jgi:hypothetical protein
MNWYKVELTEAQMMAGEFNRVQEEFQKWYLSLNAWKDTALFSRGREDGLSVTLYIYSQSPVHAEALCQMFPAEPCEPPEPNHHQAVPSRTSLVLRIGGVKLRNNIIEEISRDKKGQDEEVCCASKSIPEERGRANWKLI